MADAIKKPLIVTSACIINLLLFLFAYLTVTKSPQSITGLEDINLINFIHKEPPPEKRPNRIRPMEEPPPPPPPEEVPPVPKLAAKTPPPAPIEMDLPAPNIQLPSSIPGVPYTGEDIKTHPAQPVMDVSVSSETLPIPESITEIPVVPGAGDDPKTTSEQPATHVSGSAETLPIPESITEIPVVPGSGDDLKTTPGQPATHVSGSAETLPIPESITEIPVVPGAGDDLKTTPEQPAPHVSGSGESLSMPKIITNITPKVRIEPEYPSHALRAGIEGTVTVEFTIAVDGSVKDIEIVSTVPPKIFDIAVLKVLKRWKFLPQTVDGKAVETRARQIIRFTLRK